MNTLFAFVTLFAFITFLVGLIKSSKNKRLVKKDPSFKPNHNWKNIWLYAMIAMFAFGALFSATDTSSSSDSADTSSSEKASQSSSPSSSSSESHVTTASGQKKEGIAAKDSSSDADSSSAKKSSSTEKAKKEKKAKAKKAQEQENFRQYENALRQLPKKSNGAFTSAYYDFSKKETILVANNGVLNGTDAQVKSAVHQAWSVSQRYDEQYEPMPDSIMAYRITVQDDAGDQLAHTGVLGGFKYDFDD